MLNKMKEAIKLVKNIKKRKMNYLTNNLKSDWDDSFKEVIPFMKSRIESKYDVQS